MSNQPSQPSLDPSTPFSNALTCQKCGSHDPSVRQVMIPYVISLLAISFRHEFHGRWCWKHRLPYLLLAALITGTIGWIGFPLGFVWAPVTLYRLARGLFVHKASNVKLLRSLVDAYDQRGSIDGARRCLEGSLQYVDDLWGRQQLAAYYSQSTGDSRLPTQSGRLHPAAWLFGAAVLMSGPAGLLSHFADKVFDIPMGDLLYVFGPLFLWMPLAAIGLLLIFGLRHLQERILEGHPYQNPLANLIMALTAGLLAAYGLLEGRQIGAMIDLLLERPLLPTGSSFWITLGAVLTRGGLLEIPQELAWLDFSNFTHHIFLAAIPILFPLVLVLAAWPYLAWEKLLNQVRAQVWQQPTRPSSPGFARLAPYLAAGGLFASMLLFPQQKIIDFVQARDFFQTGNKWVYDGDLERALNAYQTAIQLDPQFSSAYVEAGWTYYLKEDRPKAIEFYLQALALDPNLANAHYDLAYIYYYDNQPDLAAAEFSKAIALDPSLYDSYMAMGWIAYEQGDLEAAETYFQKMLEYDQQAYEAYVGLGYIYEDQDRLDEEIAAYEQAANSDPLSAEAHLLLGIAYYDNNDLDLAIETLEQAVHLDYENQVARLYLTEAYLYGGKADEAVQFSRETTEYFPDWSGAHSLLALSLVETHQLDAAQAEIQAAQEFLEDSDMDRRLLIETLLEFGNYEEAIAQAQTAAQYAQRPADFYFYMADAYQQLEDYPKALEACEQADQAGARRLDVLLKQASIHLDQGQASAGLDEVKQALSIQPNNAFAHYLASLAYYDLDDLPGALQSARQAVVNDPYYYSALLNLSSLELEAGNSQQAIDAASQAAALAPYTDIPHYFLGLAYLQDGQSHRARLELNKFLELYQNLPGEEDMKKDAEDALKDLDDSA